MTAQEPADDGSHESIISSRVAERAVLNGIGKLKIIIPVTLQVALKTGSDAEKFTFSRIWTLPRTIFMLCARSLALVNDKYLVSDSDLAVEDLFIGLPVLRLLGVDTKTLFEDRLDLLDGPKCSAMDLKGHSDKGGRVSRPMVARLNRVPDNAVLENEDDKCGRYQFLYQPLSLLLLVANL